MKNLLSKMSLKRKLMLAFLSMGLIPACILTFMSLKSSSESIIHEASNSLNITRDNKAVQVENLFKTIDGQVKTLAHNINTIEAAKNFTRAYNNYVSELGEKFDKEKMREGLLSFYTNVFHKEYQKLNNENKIESTESFVDSLNDNALALQYSFISNNPNPLGSKDNLNSPKDGTSYSIVHEKYHPSFRTYLKEFEYYDIFIIDANSGNIVYSVYKEIDYATSLIQGRFAETNFGKLFGNLLKDNPDSLIIDMDRYLPSYNAPASFIGAPIRDGKNVLGYLVFQIPVGKIDTIMTNDKKWESTGFGLSGESYIIGKDKKMRTISRFLAESPDEFFKAIKKAGSSKEDMDYMKAKETSAITLSINSEAVDTAIDKNEKGSAIVKDYRGELVLSSFAPLNIKGLDWYILAEKDESEALAPLHMLRNMMFVVLGISLLLILIFSLGFSNSLSTNLSKIGSILNNTSKEVTTSANEIAESSTILSESATEAAASLQETVSSIEEISAMVNRNADFSDKSKESSEKSKDACRSGKKVVDNMINVIGDIEKSNIEISEEMKRSNQEIANIVKVISLIGEKTKVINDIVFQTKLLSFNASVEAARAGEHGKGFAVVAEEVGNLAQMSGNAAKEISEMLGESIEKVNHIAEETKTKIEKLVIKAGEKVQLGTTAANNCKEALDEILENVGNVNDMITEIAHASQEQSQGVREITKAMSQLDVVTQQNTNVAQKSSTSSIGLRNLADGMNETVKGLMGLLNGISNNESLDFSTIQSSTSKKDKESFDNVKPITSASRTKKASESTSYSEVKKTGTANVSEIPSSDDSRFEDI